MTNQKESRVRPLLAWPGNRTHADATFGELIITPA